MGGQCTLVVLGWHQSWRGEARLWMHRWPALRRGRKSYVPVVQGQGQRAHRWQALSKEKEILCASRAGLCVPVRARRLLGDLVLGVQGGSRRHTPSYARVCVCMHIPALTGPQSSTGHAPQRLIHGPRTTLGRSRG